jgi:hypothetical protein
MLPRRRSNPGWRWERPPEAGRASRESSSPATLWWAGPGDGGRECRLHSSRALQRRSAGRELPAAPQRYCPPRHAMTACGRELDRQALAAASSPALQYQTARPVRHARQETVGPLPAQIAGLKRSLHAPGTSFLTNRAEPVARCAGGPILPGSSPGEGFPASLTNTKDSFYSKASPVVKTGVMQSDTFQAACATWWCQ